MVIGIGIGMGMGHGKAGRLDICTVLYLSSYPINPCMFALRLGYL
jgi:hypothetical protein